MVCALPVYRYLTRFSLASGSRQQQPVASHGHYSLGQCRGRSFVVLSNDGEATGHPQPSGSTVSSSAVHPNDSVLQVAAIRRRLPIERVQIIASNSNSNEYLHSNEYEYSNSRVLRYSRVTRPVILVRVRVSDLVRPRVLELASTYSWSTLLFRTASSVPRPGRERRSRPPFAVPQFGTEQVV